jgi:hypothetical protein
MLKDKPITVDSHKTVFDNQWFKVKQTSSGFTYGERKGIDSVAFILASKEPNDPQPYGVVKEWKDPIEQFVTTAFGGSIDKPEYKEDLELLVQAEVIEESGFTVSKDDIWYVGKIFVSTQMSQFCHLFIVFIDKITQKEKTTTNATELKAEVTWVTAKQLFLLEDWKAPLIYSRALLNGMIK